MTLLLALQYQFEWSVLWTAPYGRWLLQGIVTTLEISALAWLLAAALGGLFGAFRTMSGLGPRGLAAAYVEFFRNVPLLVWMFFWYFGVPQVLPATAQDWLNRHGGEFVAAVVALGVYHGARLAEVVRAGIQSVPPTQLEAALSTGLTVGQAYRRVLVPIAVRLIVPPLTNESLNLLKNSSLALTISVTEVTFMTRQIEAYTAKGFEAITAGTLIYLGLCLVVAAVMSRVERRLAIPGLVVRTEGAEH
ncbi:MAG TPA: amino acid ABC transporter permease [Methylomirabilota bacterium]|nr:amino acid ABC transporter permease [Methylomirabilota bacterium]HEV8699705.1 amino acid ABC transporter permease [Candidatus Polarisedimenticolia bacterium]